MNSHSLQRYPDASESSQESEEGDVNAMIYYHRLRTTQGTYFSNNVSPSLMITFGPRGRHSSFQGRRKSRTHVPCRSHRGREAHLSVHTQGQFSGKWSKLPLPWPNNPAFCLISKIFCGKQNLILIISDWISNGTRFLRNGGQSMMRTYSIGTAYPSRGWLLLQDHI